MFLYLGLVGLWNITCLWPLFYIETFQLPDNMTTVALILLNGFLSLLFEICWTRSILLISPVIASVGLGLSVPLSLIADYVFYRTHRDLRYLLGAMCVIAGFVLANL